MYLGEKLFFEKEPCGKNNSICYENYFISASLIAAMMHEPCFNASKNEETIKEIKKKYPSWSCDMWHLEMLEQVEAGYSQSIYLSIEMSYAS